MKNLVITIIIFVIPLIACTQGIDQEEILSQATSASENLNSFSIDMDMDQKMTSEAQSEPLDVSAVIHMDMFVDPLTMHQTMIMELHGESLETESYMTQEDGFYMYDPTQEKWMKLPTEMLDQMMTISKEQMDPVEQLKLLIDYSDEFTVSELNNVYELTLSASGDKFNDLIQKLIETSLPQMQGENMMEQINIHSLTYEFLIDKETYYPSKINMELEMDIEIPDTGDLVKVYQQIHANYSNFNNVNPITIPEDVKENAEVLS